MQINCNHYRVNAPLVRTILESRKEPNLSRLIAEIASSTGCPIIVICCFVEEVLGPSDKLTALMDQIIQFYRYTEIIR